VGEVLPTASITDLCLQLTEGSGTEMSTDPKVQCSTVAELWESDADCGYFYLVIFRSKGCTSCYL